MTRALIATRLPGIPYFMTRFGEAIRERREWVGFDTATACAQASERLEMGDPRSYKAFSQSSLSRWELDKTGSAIESAHGKSLRTLAFLLKWTSAEFEAHVGVPIGRVPQLDGAPRAARVDTDLLLVDGVHINVYGAGTGPAWGDTDILDTLYIPGLKANHDYIGLKATGDSMSPYLTHGDVAIIHRDEGTVQPGDYCAVWLSDDGCVVKRLVQELDDGTLLLESLNPSNGEPRYFQAPPGSRVLGKVIHRLLNG
ncbi:MAG: S24/S26 family peptidase [Trueperaceae bacterium]|nr:S24/S26 family peptidase [Trueperaceae bacterium]